MSHIKIEAPQVMHILGMMSGTSVDSIDAALCRISSPDGHCIVTELIDFQEFPLADDLKRKIFESFKDGEHSLSLACSLNFEIARAFATAANLMAGRASESGLSIDAIASHGQTLYHVAPHMAAMNGATVASTML